MCWSLFRTLEDEPYSQCCLPERTYESFGSREGERRPDTSTVFEVEEGKSGDVSDVLLKDDAAVKNEGFQM